MKSLLAIFVVFASTIPVAAEFSWSAVFCDHMVLQRGKPLCIWGTAEPSSVVSVAFAGQDVTATAGDDGHWCAELKPLLVSTEGRELMAFCGGKTLRAKDVVVGEVWLCSGQSNMEQPLWSGGWGGGWSDRKGVIESRLAKYPLIRALKVSHVKACAPQQEMKGSWKVLTNEESIRESSAISFYFARTLRRAMPDVPVGIIEAAWGGQGIEAFVPDDLAEIYNGMIHPLRHVALRGVLWYQGENNLMRGGAWYKEQLHRLVRGWRTAFEELDLPFYLSELAPFSWGTDGALAEFQKVQRQFAAEDRNSACICINDCGDPDTVHPDRKESVGIRFALVALNRLYGRADLACDSPEPVAAHAEAGAVIVTFSNTKQLGVNSYPVFSRHSIREVDLSGVDGIWRTATQVEILGAKLRASSPDVPDPRKIRYLWRNAAAGSLYAADSNLQAPSFELDAAPSTIDAELQSKCQAVCDWAVRTGRQGALQFCAYRDGKCIVDVWAGAMSTNANAAAVSGATLFPVFSTEKPLLATAVHRMVEKGVMDYGKPLSTWWPKLRGGGKEEISLGHALAYRTGMRAEFPDSIATVEEQCDWEKICAEVERSNPVEPIGIKQRYLPISYAWLLGRPLEGAVRKPLNDILLEEVLRPSGIEHDFYFAADDTALARVATVYGSEMFETMNDDRRRKMCLPSAYAVANARAIARFYNRLEGFDGMSPLVGKSILDSALEPRRHPDDPLPSGTELKKNWHMVFGRGYGLWGEPGRLGRLYGHGGVGGSEGLCDRDLKLTVGFTCNFGKDVRKVRSKLYGIVGMKWRYWDDSEADIQNLQMSTVAK